MLVRLIRLSGRIHNTNTQETPEPNDYDVLAHHAAPTGPSLLPPGWTTDTASNIVVPHAYVGAQGRYPLEGVEWSTIPHERGKYPADLRSVVEFNGNVTYETQKTCTEIITTQRIHGELIIQWNHIATNVELASDGETPTLGVRASIRVGAAEEGGYVESDIIKEALGPLTYVSRNPQKKITRVFPAKRKENS